MINRLASLFVVLLGKIPPWVPVAALIMGKIDIFAFICLYAALLAAKALLYSFETGHTTLSAGIRTLWRYLYKPLLYIIIIEIAVYGLLYMVFLGTRMDWTLGLLALLFLTGAMIAKIFIRKDKPVEPIGILKKTVPVKIMITLLWLYVVFTGDYALFKSMALIVIYVFEYFALYNPERERWA